MAKVEFEVTIQVVCRKTYRIEAESAEEAALALLLGTHDEPPVADEPDGWLYNSNIVVSDPDDYTEQFEWGDTWVRVL